MSKLPALPLFVDAWIADTAHLTRIERGLYFDLLTLMWRTPDCRVPNDILWIARRLRCDEGEVEILHQLVAEFCQSSGNWITQKRLLKEYAFVADRVEKRRDAAKSRWNKEKAECKSISICNAPTPKPTPTPTPTDVSCVSSDTQLTDAALEACLRRAAGWESHPNPMLAVTGPIVALMEAGADLELDVLPVIRAIAPKCRKPTWKYFLDAIAEARDQRLSAASATVIPITSQTARIYHAAHRSKPSRDDSFAAIDAAINELERRQRP